MRTLTFEDIAQTATVPAVWRKLRERSAALVMLSRGGMDKPWDLRERSFVFAVAVCRFCRTLRPSPEVQDVTRQLRRAACAVAANYRSARRGKSHRDFASKLGTVIEEADEAHFWLELLVRIDLVAAPAVEELMNEANELVKIFTACQKTARKPH